MALATKPFRIEQILGNESSRQPQAANGSMSGGQYQDIMTELAALKSMMAPAQDLNENIVESYRAEMSEALKLKKEMDEIYQAIAETKREIATLHVNGLHSAEMNRVTDELDAIVQGTEQATEQILASAEIIDENASKLSKVLTGEEDQWTHDIQESVVSVFEACNFQDLTGQRITKVVNVLRFIEGRIVNMMDIWGGIDHFKEIEVENPMEKQGDAALLNGPALDNEEGVASQDDIDALFD
ncbi:chemotaxis protein CheZ [Cohaesibacter sp. ES.047]|uniref:protein phosphatase CheZ n=1 Tax=Cohaesibacter sp. ES.047 TaxID=1798205 RepID=UPI000BB72B13|nr:protein phosphatase CheZ [Cohaesibacter sp. ES.047]SNY92085.1 chemotaxis protein CheZ [Cohaesibacter sp. ES.047]